MPDWLIIILGIISTSLTLGGGLIIARRYEKMGGGEAQAKLNVTLKELTDAYEEKLRLRDGDLAAMKAEMAGCKDRLESMERREIDLAAQVKAREELWLNEKIELKHELAEVYRRLGMTKRENDPSEVAP
jgi:hypothetical protein